MTTTNRRLICAVRQIWNFTEQGSSLITNIANQMDDPSSKNRTLRRFCVRCCAILAMAILMVIEPASAFGQNGNGLFQRRSNLQGSPSFDLDRYRLRIIWGGGQADVWQGNLVLEDGTFENVRVLGLEPDAGAGIEVSSNEVQIRTSRKSNYSGFDIDIVGDRNQKLMLDLQSVTPDGRLSGLQSQQIDLGSLLNSFDSNINSIQIPLDDTGNRIDINLSLIHI